jgi:DNA-binding transcriptional LysR family regulator
VRSARGLSPTRRALQLRPELDAIMRSLQVLVSGAAPFDPATTTREFTVVAPIIAR